MEGLENYYNIIRTGTPKLKFCEHFDDTSHMWNFTRHSHPYIEVMYFMEGQGDLEVSGQTYSISLYDAVVYPARWEHQEAGITKRKRDIICLWIDLPELELDSPIQLHDQGNMLSQLFLSIHQEAKREVPEPLLLEYALKMLLTLILRNNSEERSRGGMLGDVLQYIHVHYTEPITLDQLADLEHISKSYLSRQFKQRTGQTVIAYINSLRIEMAKHLLTGTQESVNEIAYQVGFESPKYFYRTFRAYAGDSPASFRRQYKSEPSLLKK